MSGLVAAMPLTRASNARMAADRLPRKTAMTRGCNIFFYIPTCICIIQLIPHCTVLYFVIQYCTPNGAHACHVRGYGPHRRTCIM